ncbi:heat shock protein HslVU, ATPase subunit HslU, putative (macronuclear) [Tetrahymena thermophila SB210]|uniref:Heat shock protein HslVU, ATPase subunit HslU, putative n=1 Tax=Tetrahymena thermophila (strain SB210) TaxID=312017 RepID=I7LVY7_TETTS|nr:heat shock protein HslVU, ATPase subunit HslU, putative [Tetrahymena thermophila SB210]EAS00354.1 heat shock protein HslVU, ATPase subunit HslU, putative [Tetrahymena thermophila SB210]|eukprot:XP_001020599.1 heat shock protein HslVU, ATPase subunit HslU, putative [Tetrahymena thermophila SB210]
MKILNLQSKFLTQVLYKSFSNVSSQFAIKKSSSMTPKEVVEYLSQHIIGQEQAKRAVAIAYRNRWRRQFLEEDLKKEVCPKNILMVGPTGSGKTEIARRLAQLSDAPFIKVEATKYTEVGYHGKDVEQIIQDLVRTAVRNAKANHKKNIENAKQIIEQIVLDQIVDAFLGPNFSNEEVRNKKREDISNNLMDDRRITVELPHDYWERVNTKGSFQNIDEFLDYIKNFKQGLNPKNDQQRLTVKGARSQLYQIYEEALEKSVNYEKIAIRQVEEEGIVFIDEIDKIATSGEIQQNQKSPSADGVQRDLLPLIEGTVVSTKWGDVKTDHILFITAGAFSMSKPSDLIPELLGRLPIRVELQQLKKNELYSILKFPKYNMIFQQQQLLKQEGLNIQFTDEAVKKIAILAEQANTSLEDIGARRLHELIERCLENISFDAPYLEQKDIVIDQQFVDKTLQKYMEKADYRKFLI